MSDSVPARDFRMFLTSVIAGDITDVRRRLAANSGLATIASETGATRSGARAFFFPRIRHYVYAGDTALHMAAAAYQREIAALLVAHGADCAARDRFRIQPLHLAATTNHWNPTAQIDTIAYLLAAGADPNAADRLGVTPLHRAVRTRSSLAVKALLAGGADPRRKNGSGSTPLHLAVQTTGRGGSGAPHARAEQGKIIRLLLDGGASVADRDGRGRSARQAATASARHLIASRD